MRRDVRWTSLSLHKSGGCDPDAIEEDVMAMTRRHRAALVGVIMLASLLLFGCDFLDGLLGGVGSRAAEEDREAGQQAIEDILQPQEPQKQQEHKADADQVLASGQVLSVRIHYGESGATQCQVRIDNERNGWYDEIEDTAQAGVLGSAEKAYGDYPFGSENFNWQLTRPEYYDPKDAKGDYRITVTASTGYSATAKVTWDGERFNPSLLSFSLD